MTVAYVRRLPLWALLWGILQLLPPAACRATEAAVGRNCTPQRVTFAQFQQEYRGRRFVSDPYNATCHGGNLPRLRFLLADLHEGCIADNAAVLSSLGQDVRTQYLCGRWVPYMLPCATSPVLRALSEIYSHPNADLTPAEMERFMRDLRGDPVMDVDVIVCSYPPSLCELYARLGTSIVIDACHRVTLGRCREVPIWRRWIAVIRALSVLPWHAVAAKGGYDAEYIRHYTGVAARPLYTSSRLYTKPPPRYAPTSDFILLGPVTQKDGLLQARFLRRLQRAAEARYGPAGDGRGRWPAALGRQPQFQWIRRLYPQKYNFSQLAQHPAVVLVPYAVLTYSMTELYSLNIPMFVPSLRFLLEWRLITDRIGRCHKRDSAAVHAKLDAVAACDVHAGRHPHSPNSPAAPATAYWLRFADFYRWHHVVVWDSLPDLLAQLEAADLPAIAARMEAENRAALAAVRGNWTALLCRLAAHQPPNRTAAAAALAEAAARARTILE